MKKMKDQTSKNFPLPNEQLDASLFNGNVCPKVSPQPCNEKFFILESNPVPYITGSSSSSTVHSISPQSSNQSYTSDVLRMSSISPLSGSLGHIESSRYAKLKEIEWELLANDSDIVDDFSSSNVDLQVYYWGLEKLLVHCAEAVDNADYKATETFMNLIKGKISISGEPLQRLGAYVLEGLKARQLKSGSTICAKLTCNSTSFQKENSPSSPDLMTSMQTFARMCPYFKFGYVASNILIEQAMLNESNIHIIDFQIAQGNHWITLLRSLSLRPGGCPRVHITGIDDPQSIIARGGGIEIVADKLANAAKEFGIDSFKFQGVATSGEFVNEMTFEFEEGEAVAVAFPFILHHMPDGSSFNTINHRDRLISLAKRLRPKIVTLVEQELNCNRESFIPRFKQALEYYKAIFESIDASHLARDDKERISAEENCVASDIVNIIACEGLERKERPEVFNDWFARFVNAGFITWPVDAAVENGVRNVLSDYSTDYGMFVDPNGNGLCLCWRDLAMATFSAWR